MEFKNSIAKMRLLTKAIPMIRVIAVAMMTVSTAWSQTVPPEKPIASNKIANALAAAITITGTVSASGAPVANVVMSGLPDHPVTNLQGLYRSTVSSGWTGTITPTLAGTAFAPVQKTFVSLITNQNNIDFQVVSTQAPACFITHLLLLYPNTDVEYMKAGQVYRYTGSLSASHKNAIINSYNNLAYLTIDGSGNVVFSRQEVRAIDHPITKITRIFDHSYWVTPNDIVEDLANEAPPGKYDSIHVVWNSGPMESEYWGLGGVLISSSPGLSTYDCLIAGAEWWYTMGTTAANLGGVFLHEWLHGVSSFERSYGVVLPERDADGAGLHNYTDATPEGWMVYYRDLMQGKVWEPGLSRLTGIGPQDWNDRTPNHHHGLFGKIIQTNGIGIAGWPLSFTNGISETSSDGGGNYFQSVFEGWTGTMTPIDAQRTFTPASRSYANVIANQGGQDFTSDTIDFALTSPNGGESWVIGSIQGISWLSGVVSGNLNINLYKGTSNLGAIATAVPVGNGVYNWKAGYLKNGTKVALGSPYRISLVSAADKTTSDISDAYFSLVKPKISVKTPVSGAVWKANSVQRITWTYTAVSGTVNIFLYRYGVLKGQVAASIPVSDLGFSWTVGTLNAGGTVPIGAGYSVRVTTSDGKVSGKSGGTFTIRR